MVDRWASNEPPRRAAGRRSNVRNKWCQRSRRFLSRRPPAAAGRKACGPCTTRAFRRTLGARPDFFFAPDTPPILGRPVNVRNLWCRGRAGGRFFSGVAGLAELSRARAGLGGFLSPVRRPRFFFPMLYSVLGGRAEGAADRGPPQRLMLVRRERSRRAAIRLAAPDHRRLRAGPLMKRRRA